MLLKGESHGSWNFYLVASSSVVGLHHFLGEINADALCGVGCKDLLSNNGRLEGGNMGQQAT